MIADLHVVEGTSTVSGPRPLIVCDLGLIPYLECWQQQRDLASEVSRGDVQDTLLFLEHPHTFTCGRGGGRDHILASPSELAALGVSVLDVDRGGDVTYHGPGQLVAYPIINLFTTPIGRDYRGYVRALEQALMDSLADFAISSHRIPGYSGVWVHKRGNEEKIAAIGVKVDGRGVTTHGIALNVDTDLGYFDKIVPCGIVGKGVTSMARLLPNTPGMEDVKASFVRHFRQVFAFL